MENEKYTLTPESPEGTRIISDKDGRTLGLIGIDSSVEVPEEDEEEKK